MTTILWALLLSSSSLLLWLLLLTSVTVLLIFSLFLILRTLLGVHLSIVPAVLWALLLLLLASGCVLLVATFFMSKFCNLRSLRSLSVLGIILVSWFLVWIVEMFDIISINLIFGCQRLMELICDCGWINWNRYKISLPLFQSFCLSWLLCY